MSQPEQRRILATSIPGPGVAETAGAARFRTLQRCGRRTGYQGGVVTITSYNPRTGQANGTVEEMSSHEVQAAVERASGAGSAVAQPALESGAAGCTRLPRDSSRTPRKGSNWPRQRPRWVTRASPPRSRARPASCASTAMWPPRAPTSLPRSTPHRAWPGSTSRSAPSLSSAQATSLLPSACSATTSGPLLQPGVQ